MKLTVLPALLLSLLASACATSTDEADDVGSASSRIVACEDGALDVELETVYLEDEHALLVHGPHKEPKHALDIRDIDGPHKGPASSGVIQPLDVTAASADLATDAALDVRALCECADDGCVVAWIDDSLGCGVCAHVACADGERGGCVPCERVDEPAAESCVFADAPAAALE